VNIELKSYETADKVVDLIEHFIADKYWNYNQFIEVLIGMPKQVVF
jgi:glycerophosphoryl diester phosphodiesterase